MTGPFEKYVRDHLANTIAQREEVLTAFVAKYGWEPERTVQVMQQLPNGVTHWYLRRMTDEEMQQASMDGASL